MATFIVGAIVFTLLFLAIRSMVKKSKSNGGGCGCNCPGCSSKESCNSGIKFKNKLNS
ncbi:FeoB-associated Cys-rich membrane protein [Clostridium sp. D53t1_180928_C8]|uniref:FeoB-associated Cys-rich membrane protein n=1 Tax=Clostridium sp. D53t1_180928_C8 TaxID=2787101 RepID=UPI0018AC3D26|nr:FeoB-associated Cys-rich membrane protein [Clostridium sp. D53t1_180928_C8]